MGTYTTNYNLFMPTVGEQGWGELVNGNFETIDTTMAGLNTRMGTAETNITSLTSRMGTAEPIITSNTSRIETLETETDGRLSDLENIVDIEGGGVIGFLFVKGTIQVEEGDEVYASHAGLSEVQMLSTAKDITVNGYSILYVTPKRHTYGVYTRDADLYGDRPSELTSLTLNIRFVGNSMAQTGVGFYYKKSTDSSYTSVTTNIGKNVTINKTIEVDVGSTYQCYCSYTWGSSGPCNCWISIPAQPTYYVKYDTP